MKRWLAICLIMGAGSVWAMGAWSGKEQLRGFDLSPTELKQISIQSGWSSDDPQLMMFEVGNRLSGPIYCVGASFDMKDGKKIQHSFEPKLYVPADQKRNASVRGIEKKNLKSFGFTCRCMKQAPQAVCENPYK
jgi:hypothetical protein